MEHKDVLIVDKDLGFVENLATQLDDAGLSREHAKSLEVALNLLESEAPEIIISLDDIDGCSSEHIISTLKQAAPKASLLLIGDVSPTAQSVQQAVNAIKLGANHYFLKQDTAFGLVDYIQATINQNKQDIVSSLQADEDVSERDPTNNIKFSLSLDIRQHEYRLILQTLEKTEGSRKHTAELLNISPRTLRYKLAKMRDEGFSIPISSRRQLSWANKANPE